MNPLVGAIIAFVLVVGGIVAANLSGNDAKKSNIAGIYYSNLATVTTNMEATYQGQGWPQTATMAANVMQPLVPAKWVKNVVGPVIANDVGGVVAIAIPAGASGYTLLTDGYSFDQCVEILSKAQRGTVNQFGVGATDAAALGAAPLTLPINNAATLCANTNAIVAYAN